MKSINIDVLKDSILNPSFDKRSEVFMWGLTSKDNKLPSIIEHLLQESVTAKACLKRCINAVMGKGLEGGDQIVNPHNLMTANQVLRAISKDLIGQSNFFVHARFDGNYDVKSIKPITAKKCRIGSADDQDYSGKILVADWSAKRIAKQDIEVVDRLNLNKDVIEAQVQKAGSLGKYKGQILHVKTDIGYKYAPSDLYPVLEDAELEKLSKIFRRNGGKYGFLNAKAVIVGEMTDSEERAFKKDLESMQGAENASNMLVFQATNKMADLEKQIIVKDLSNKLDDKILMYSDEAAEAAICKAFGVPLALISGRSEGIFGNSGEMLNEMKKQLYLEKEFERMLIEESLTHLFKKSVFDIKEAKIIDPFKTTEQ